MVAKVTSCKRCDRPIAECGPLSARKLCHDCGAGNVWRVAWSLRLRTGPDYDHWRRATILALLDLDTPPGTSLDLISDDRLREVLTAGQAEVLPSR